MNQKDKWNWREEITNNGLQLIQCHCHWYTFCTEVTQY